MTRAANCVIGRARTVLVSHTSGEPVAVGSTVLARLLRRQSRQRMDVSGSVQLAGATRQHLEEVVIPAVHRVTDALGLHRRGFELCIVNVAAAAARDLDVRVDGFSLDAAAGLAMLAASCRLPIRQDTIVTGQLASTAGDIRPVGSLSDKLKTASVADDAQQFLYPSLDEDNSLQALAPELRSRIVEAIAAASSRIRVIAVTSFAEIVQHAAADRGRLEAALSAGYFHQVLDDLPDTAMALVDGLEGCFWRTLETDLYGGHLRQARRLLERRMRYQLRRREYPHDFGTRLNALVRSVPPPIRRRRAFFPLLPAATCFEIGRLARSRDQQDAVDLVCAALGRFTGAAHPTPDRADQPRVPVSAEQNVDATLEAISAESLAREIGIPADDARASFVLPGVVIDDHDAFNDTITAFHLALLRHVDKGIAVAQPDEALSLLERTYADSGGLAGARSEARFAVEGGMRRVLDQMTERFKMEQRFKRVNRVLKEALDPLDWDGQVAFMGALLERLRSHLPEELRQADPGRFVRRQEEIVRVYVQALDRVHGLFRTL